MSITNIYFNCTLQGDNFDPTPLLGNNQLEIIDYHHRGEVDQRKGREGRIFEDGGVLFTSKGGGFEEFVKKLYSIKDLMVGNPVDDRRVVYIALEYEGHCNWEIEPHLLKMIGEL